MCKWLIGLCAGFLIGQLAGIHKRCYRSWHVQLQWHCSFDSFEVKYALSLRKTPYIITMPAKIATWECLWKQMAAWVCLCHGQHDVICCCLCCNQMDQINGKLQNTAPVQVRLQCLLGYQDFPRAHGNIWEKCDMHQYYQSGAAVRLQEYCAWLEWIYKASQQWWWKECQYSVTLVRTHALKSSLLGYCGEQHTSIVTTNKARQKPKQAPRGGSWTGIMALAKSYNSAVSLFNQYQFFAQCLQGRKETLLRGPLKEFVKSGWMILTWGPLLTVFSQGFLVWVISSW